MEVLAAIFSLIMLLGLFALLLAVWIIVPVIFYRLSMKKPERTVLYMFLFFFLSPFGIIIATILLGNKFNKMKQEVYDNTRINPSDKSVDDLIAFLERYGCTDTPNAWHQLRGIWYACNQSNKITTGKKNELKTFLLTKGLYLNRDEGNVIDNFGR